MRYQLILAAIAITLSACNGPAAEPAPKTAADTSVHPESGLRIIPVTITHAGNAHVIQAELAQTSRDQAKGLMFRTSLGPNEGMLFPFDPPKLASFWMRNTVIPLDLVFIAADGRVTNIAARARPYDESKLQSAGLVKAVLEIPGGRANELGLEAGDLVHW